MSKFPTGYKPEMGKKFIFWPNPADTLVCECLIDNTMIQLEEFLVAWVTLELAFD